jgi:hypothetical protein
MTIRNPQPTMRRDFGDRSWTLTVAKKNFGRALALRPSRQSPAIHEIVGTYDAVDNEHAQGERAASRQQRSEVHAPETSWEPRSTLLLIVSVAALFWGTFFWIFLAESASSFQAATGPQPTTAWRRSPDLWDSFGPRFCPRSG